MNVAEWIVNALIEKGVTHLFTLQGGFSMYLNDAIGHSALKPVYMLHESGAAWAAKGYAQFAGKMGVCVITSGLAQTNAFSGIASAWSNYLPVMVISGDIHWKQIYERDRDGLRQGGQQDIPLVRMVSPITKSAVCAGTARAAKEFFRSFWDRAMEEPRGPVWLDIPIDVQQEEA